MMERLRFKCEACGFENLSFGEEQLETLRSEFPAGSPQQLFASVASDYRNFWGPLDTIRRIEAPVSPESFFRDYVAKNTPVVIRGLADNWPAMQKWSSKDYLAHKMKNRTVTVNVTPNGLGDSVLDATAYPRRGVATDGVERERDGETVEIDANHVFVKPEERQMSFDGFLEALQDDNYDGLPYLSHQNDCLRTELCPLLDDVEVTIPLAQASFKNDPDAVNIWIGDERVVSSVHKDHYENLYTVIEGEKHFILLPPSDVLFLEEGVYRQARFHKRRKCETASERDDESKQDSEGTWEVLLETGEENPPVSWICVDPATPNLKRHPLIRLASPLHVVLRPGETLYLPSLWYHRVTQKGFTIAVNHWHDMDFDFKWVYYNALSSLKKQCKLLLTPNEAPVGNEDSKETAATATALTQANSS